MDEALIKLKVKTLDSQNHEFTVDNEITVKQFKEFIAEKVSVAADLQRLIYCGRVLNDEKPLKEYDVNGKVVHLVQRSPPSSRPSNNSGGLNANDNPSFRRPRMQNVIGTRTLNMSELENMMMGTFTIPVNGSSGILGQQATQPSLNPSSTLCMNRITVARYMLRCADNIAAYLENPAVGLNNTAMDMLHSSTMESTVFEVGISAVTNSDIPQSHVNDIVSAFQGAVSAAFRQNGISNITVQNDNSGVQMFGSVPGQAPPTGSPSSTASISLPINFSQMSDFNAANVANAAATAAVNAIRASTGDATPSSASERPRQQTTRTQTLGEVVGEMRHVQRRLEPFLELYHAILVNDPVFDNDADRDNAQRVFDRVSEALHYISHAQHAISDLMLDLNSTSPRHLCCRPILVEQSAFVSSGIAAVPHISFAPMMQNNNNNTSNVNNNNPETANNNAVPTSAASTTANDNRAPSAPSGAASNAQENGDGREGHNSLNNEGSENIATASSRDRVERFIQSIVNTVQPNTELHIINANINMPNIIARPPPAGANPPATTACSLHNNSSQTNTTTTSSNGDSGAAGQRRVRSVTLPTTSTQTRSTARPQILTSTTLPQYNLRPIPPNVLSSFDRFLPCNSHHIRDHNQQQAAQNAPPVSASRRSVSLDRNVSRPTSAPPVPARASSSSSSTTAFDPFGALRRSSKRIKDSTVVQVSQEEYTKPFVWFGITLTLQDLDDVNAGFFNNLRQELRQHFIGNYFGGQESDDSLIATCIEQLIHESAGYLIKLNSIRQSPDYDVQASIQNLFRKTLPSIIRLVTDDDSTEFGGRLQRELITFCENVFMILVKCIGLSKTQIYLTEIGNLAMTGINDEHFSRLPRYLINTYLIDRRSFDLSEIQEFLVVKLGPASETVAPMDVDETWQEAETTPTAAPLVEAEMSMEAAEIDGVLPAAEIITDPRLAVFDHRMLPPSLPRVANGSEDWHSQFPSHWLPVITRDMSRQRRQNPQASYSDSYISGMSSKRRKLLQSQKPSTDMQKLLSEGVRHAVQTVKNPRPSSSRQTQSSTSNFSSSAVEEIVSVIASDSNVQSAYREAVAVNIQDRLKKDEDYNSERFSHLASGSSKNFKN